MRDVLLITDFETDFVFDFDALCRWVLIGVGWFWLVLVVLVGFAWF